MRNTVLFFFICLLGLLAVQPAVRAQYGNRDEKPVQRAVPDTAWSRLTALPAFYYRDAREGVQPPQPPPRPSALSHAILAIIAFFSSTAGQILLSTVLIGVVAYVAWRLMLKDGRFAFRSARKLNGGAEPDIEDLHGTDWLRPLEEAAAAGNLRAAVRYGYLHLLQTLGDRSLIQYRPGKTNGDYAAELAGNAAAPGFRALSRSYEYAWYGGYPITAQQFEAFRAGLVSLQNTPRA